MRKRSAEETNAGVESVCAERTYIHALSTSQRFPAASIYYYIIEISSSLF